jgi:hypothetical protein
LRKEIKLTIGEYAVNVEDEDLDAARAVFRGKSHATIIVHPSWRADRRWPGPHASPG